MVTEMVTELANLPKREIKPDDLMTLPEIFRIKGYMTEIKGALKRGYSFDELAEIISERCGVAISARQIRYHFTRAQNMGKKSGTGQKTAKKPGGFPLETKPKESGKVAQKELERRIT